MLAGELYLTSDPELAAGHLRAQAILAKFNALRADEDALRLALLTELFGHLGGGAVVKPTLRCDYGYNISIGARSFVNYDGVLLVCPGVTIGENTIVGAGSVVTRSLPAGVVAAGNPCRMIRPVEGRPGGS
jgi:maltose O-acetyltransferase